MVLALRVTRELRPVEVDLAQVAGRVPLCLVVEVPRSRVAALATRRHGARADAVAELDHRDETVSAGPVPLPRARICASAEGGQRAPLAGCEADGDARAR